MNIPFNLRANACSLKWIKKKVFLKWISCLVIIQIRDDLELSFHIHGKTIPLTLTLYVFPRGVVHSYQHAWLPACLNGYQHAWRWLPACLKTWLTLITLHISQSMDTFPFTVHSQQNYQPVLPRCFCSVFWFTTIHRQLSRTALLYCCVLSVDFILSFDVAATTTPSFHTGKWQFIASSDERKFFCKHYRNWEEVFPDW